ncbi:MAG: ATP-binding cassette domain-containing protein [Planctomycetaceae bacterium]|nr:ATP-binding cassette domain-containing protein [Planctomycetaceae bacterium]
MPFELTDVTFEYPGAEKPSLRNVTAVIHPGRTTAIVGESGSGKSTLLSLLGLLWEGPLQSGRIVYDDGARRLDYAGMARATPWWSYLTRRRLRIERARLRLREFGFVLQSSYMLKHLTCARNAALPLAMQQVPLAERTECVDGLLKKVEPGGRVFKLRDRPARKVSGGEGQRIAVVRALAHDPRVIFADEPVSSLDRRNSKAILEMLVGWRERGFGRTARADRTLILVNHDIRSTWPVADDLLVLRDGYLVSSGPKERFDGPEAVMREMEGDARGTPHSLPAQAGDN